MNRAARNGRMRFVGRMYRALLLGTCLTVGLPSLSCVDVGGFIVSSDVDERFKEGLTLGGFPDVAFNDQKFSFIVMSDLHIYGGTDEGVAAIKDRIIESDKFILAAGDITQDGTTEDLAIFKSYMSHTGIPCYAVPGNHDLYFNGWDSYKKVMGRTFFSAVAGPVRIIGLDSANGTLGPGQREWLENELASSKETLKIVLTHFQFFSPHPWELQQYTDIREIYYLLDLFGRHGVAYTFTGHSHYYDSHVVRGVIHLTMPAFEIDQSFIRVHVDGTNVTYERVRVE